MRGLGACGTLADAGRPAGAGCPTPTAAADVREEERLQRIQARMAAETTSIPAPVRHRPKPFTVFAAAFIAGAAAAVGVNRVLDVQLAQRRPQVECEPIFVALRGLPQGAPITVWDVALKDWPKAMLPSSALRAGDTFEGYVLRHPVREGQPLLAVQLVRSGAAATSTVAAENFTPPVPAAAAPATPSGPQADPWMPAESIGQSVAKPVAPSAPPRPTTDDVAAAAASTVTATGTASAGTQTATTPQMPEPTPAEPSPAQPVAQAPAPTIVAAPQPMPPSPTDIDPPPSVRPQPSVDDDADAMSEAVATDVQSMPSVMTSVSQPVSAAARPARGDAGRYLVVPERIALQADTSFTTPQPEPPGPPTARPVAAPAQQTTRRETQQRPPAVRSPQQQSSQRKTTPPAAPRDQKQAAVPQRPWGGMFPNVAAGIEAMSGSWQRSRPTAQQPAQPTRR